jgi:polyribonucleotide nucleotidyltransferase
MVLSRSCEIGGRPLTIETGELAKQADGAVVVRYGETMVLVTAVMARSKRDVDFLPLTVELVEKTYSAGKIPGGYFKREGRPTESEVLNSRLIDRPLRPLFPKGCRNEIQVIATVLSMDKENDQDVLGVTGASCALMLSDIPWEGPVAAVRVARIAGDFVVNPLISQLEQADLNFVVAVGNEGIVMVEGESTFVPEAVVIDALLFAQEQAQPLLKMQEEMARKLKVRKREIDLPQEDLELAAAVAELSVKGLEKALSIAKKKERNLAVDELLDKVKEQLAEKYPERQADAAREFEAVKKRLVRTKLAGTGKRIDGRGMTDVRPISCKVSLLPRAHGSALFTRGETQALVTVTLGTAEDEQRIDGLTGDRIKRFMLHYNFPPFSVGEVRMLRGPGRRDIGHGHLAERGTQRVLPEYDKFPYTIRVVSEILESNGSSSMATVCGTSMALMEAGVPVSGPVAGVAMGLVKEGTKFFVLSDILGDEDHLGDMDFKVVGNQEGVSALQMDIKVEGLTREVLEKALSQAREARLHILKCMEEGIAQPKSDLSPHAPRITSIMINKEKIGALIGPGGKNIRSIIEQSGAAIDVNDDGRVNVAAVTAESARKAIDLIRACTAEAELNKIYDGRVVKITDFGAFVELMPGVEGLCHISELSDRRVRRVEDVLREGDTVRVKVIEIDSKSGKVRLSRREAVRG